MTKRAEELCDGICANCDEEIAACKCEACQRCRNAAELRRVGWSKSESHDLVARFGAPSLPTCASCAPAKIAHDANNAARGGDRTYPRLTAASSADDIATWIQTCDPNGCHTADLATAEGFVPYTTEGAWLELAAMLAND